MSEEKRMRRKKVRASLSFIIMGILLAALIFAAVNIGSLKVSPSELFRGLFLEEIDDVAAIYDLRFPRIVISLFAGAAVAVSGVLFQAVLKNPLADPGIIGISGGAQFCRRSDYGLCSRTVFFHSPVCLCGRPAGVFPGVQPVVERGIKPSADYSDRRGGERHVYRAFRGAEFHDRGKLLRRGVHCGGKYHPEDLG